MSRFGIAIAPRALQIGCAVLVIGQVVARPALTAPPVRGDRDALQQLLAAQETNSTLFPRGRMVADIVERETARETTAHVTMLWDGSSKYWQYSLEDAWPDRELVDSQTGTELIEAPGELCWFHRSAGPGVARRLDPSRKPYRGIWDIHPDDTWFALKRSGRPWAHEFDPEHAPPALQAYDVRREADVITVVHDYFVLEQHVETVIVANLAKGGNVTSFRQHAVRNAPDGVFSYIYEGTYDWAEDKNGHSYLKNAISFGVIQTMKIMWSGSITCRPLSSIPIP